MADDSVEQAREHAATTAYRLANRLRVERMTDADSQTLYAVLDALIAAVRAEPCVCATCGGSVVCLHCITQALHVGGTNEPPVEQHVYGCPCEDCASARLFPDKADYR